MAEAIGSLFVNLGVNSAEFVAGLQQAQGSLNKFVGTLKGIAAAAGASLSFAAVSASIKSSIDHMDELGKAAQKIGIPVEELSKLEYAAKLSDVSLEDLTSTLGKFSKSIAQVAGGGENDAGAALKALGLSATDAQGRLRPTTAIIADVAEAFAGMKDGAGKTALAIALFGKSGAQLIPLLNGGKKALSEAAQEATVFGIVVSKEAAGAAEHFNDNLTRLDTASRGLRQQIATALLPTLNDITDAMVTFASKGDIAKKAAEFLGEAMQQAAIYAATTYKEFYAVSRMLDVLAENASDPQGFAVAKQRWSEAFGDIQEQAQQTAITIGQIGGDSLYGSLKSIDALVASWNKLEDTGKKEPPIIPDLAKAKKAAAEAAAALKVLKTEAKKVWDDTRTPLEHYNDEVAKLKKLLDANVISTDTYGRAIQKLKGDLFAADIGFQQLGEDWLTVSEQLAMAIPDSLGSAAEDLAGNFSDAFATIVSGTGSVQDAFANMARGISQTLEQLAAELLKSSIITLLKYLPMLLGGGGGAGINFGGMTFGGLYADGGNLGAGQWGIAGEAGPEIIHGPARITPMDKMGGGSGNSVNIQIINNSSAQTRKQEDGNGNVRVIIEDVVSDMMIRGGNKIDAAMNRGYGLRRAGR